ncbi:hypothetical protein NPIL_647491 [Nephila pilipes]|uniref:Uncharacterized protein n=1 Tax=Nephila pilipes TaxID=299642 RepID=A0A8X6UFT4_NEPPI|nr:hypothetical protein NPIL_647491 [Nephila pilipes]
MTKETRHDVQRAYRKNPHYKRETPSNLFVRWADSHPPPELVGFIPRGRKETHLSCWPTPAEGPRSQEDSFSPIVVPVIKTSPFSGSGRCTSIKKL